MRQKLWLREGSWLRCNAPLGEPESLDGHNFVRTCLNETSEEFINIYSWPKHQKLDCM